MEASTKQKQFSYFAVYSAFIPIVKKYNQITT